MLKDQYFLCAIMYLLMFIQGDNYTGLYICWSVMSSDTQKTLRKSLISEVTSKWCFSERGHLIDAAPLLRRLHLQFPSPAKARRHLLFYLLAQNQLIHAVSQSYIQSKVAVFLFILLLLFFKWPLCCIKRFDTIHIIRILHADIVVSLFWNLQYTDTESLTTQSVADWRWLGAVKMSLYASDIALSSNYSPWDQ